MFQQFINRTEELNILKDSLHAPNPQFIMIYGRRRVGKTELITHFIEDKPAIYFLAEQKRYHDNIEEMKEIMGTHLKDEEFKIINFENWVQLFKSFTSRIKKRTIIIIDEFPYLVEQDASIPSEFQKIWDMHLSKSENIILILIGSSVSMMEKLLGRKSPLFGRRTAQLEIKPINIFHIKDFLPSYSMEECIKAYACTDGIPLYLNQFNSKLPVFENIKNTLFRRDAILYNEAEILLKQEFREPANYFAILKALSFGYTKQSEIANHTGIDKSIISKYLQNLEEIRIVKKEHPLTDKKEKRKNSRYDFQDNYFRFWFRFIYPNKSRIERGVPEAIETMKKNYSAYLGFIFEKTAAEFLWKTMSSRFTKLGRWWHKDIEIDLIALNEEKKEIFFFECKWKQLKEETARHILYKLKQKSKYVDWHKDKRKEHYGLIAKKLENKDNLQKEGYTVFDLDDFCQQ